MSSNNIALVQNDAIITNYKVIPKKMNNFFINTTKKPHLKPIKSSFDTDINQIISVYKSHVSITKTQECFPNIDANDFNFRQVSLKKEKSGILNANIKKSSTKGSIPVMILKQCVDIFLSFSVFLLQKSIEIDKSLISSEI